MSTQRPTSASDLRNRSLLDRTGSSGSSGGSGWTTWSGWSSGIAGFLGYAIGIVAFAFVVTLPLDFYEQLVFGVVTLVAAWIIVRLPGRVAPIIVVLMSIAVSSRYLWWRVTETAFFDSWIEAVLGLTLLAAEMYAFVCLVLGYFQTIWPLRRRPAEMPSDVSRWPTVDVYIPTYNEPLSVVKPTVLAALGMDWPADKLNVCILDDGRRPEFKAFAEAAGVRYFTRADNKHAKAGNINAALVRTSGDLVAVFDCDHIPTRSFLQMTVGHFLKDPGLAMVQTPHHFFSPDPFEKNLRTFKRVPNEDELFYGLVQSGNDLWNAAFFCGSCAVLRRKALDEVGGIATQTLTEDAHTSISLHRAGWSSAYLSIPQASGLATATLRDHVRQRSRWARGMAQIFRIENPIFASGLSLAQRLCYSNAMLHFFYGLPRLVFLTSPLAFLYFGLHIFNATAWMIAVYALPHFIHSYIANARLNGAYRHSFWSEVFESTLAWYVMRAAIGGVLRPSRGAFVVTPKGQQVSRDHFDWRTSTPILWLFWANVIGLVLGFVRAFWWNAHEVDTVIMNMAWTVFNLILLGACIAVAREVQQVRDTQRVAMRLPAVIERADGTRVPCEVENYSEGGLAVNTYRRAQLAANEALTVSLFRGEQEFKFPATAAFVTAERVGLKFGPLTLAHEARLIQCTFSRADAWLKWAEDRVPDKPLRGFAEVAQASLRGIAGLAGAMFGRRERRSHGAASDAIDYGR